MSRREACPQFKMTSELLENSDARDSAMPSVVVVSSFPRMTMDSISGLASIKETPVFFQEIRSKNPQTSENLYEYG